MGRREDEEKNEKNEKNLEKMEGTKVRSVNRVRVLLKDTTSASFYSELARKIMRKGMVYVLCNISLLWEVYT